MTEREKREKAIAEMTRHFGEMARCHCECDDSKISCYKCFAIKVYDAGYRKADEVRKDTVKDFSNRVDEIISWCISNKIGDDFDYEYFTNCLQNLKKEFGVEVEE